jgi:blocked-early-in-transport protein 1
LSADAGFSAYPGANNGESGRGSGDGGFRSATPNKKGQYSNAVLDELESQNDEQIGIMSGKVRMLKDVSCWFLFARRACYAMLWRRKCWLNILSQLTNAIGGEIRDSTARAEKMNDQFEGTRNRLRGTMNRMLRMAEKTGVGWKVWVGFFAFLVVLFWYVRFS